VPFSQAQIAEALAKVKADPNLATERTIRSLEWANQPKPPSHHMSQWLEWIAELFQWLAQSARVLIWVAAGLLAALLALYIVRLVRAHGPHREKGEFVAPSFVRDLDIRPESLPTDIGAAALALWERGEHRAALALLYRGLLSRLVHAHRVPILDSSTEGDCLELTARHLNSDRTVYVERLVKTWQRAIYGGQDPETPAVAALCSEFAPALNVPAEPAS